MDGSCNNNFVLYNTFKNCALILWWHCKSWLQEFKQNSCNMMLDLKWLDIKLDSVSFFQSNSFIEK